MSEAGAMLDHDWFDRPLPANVRLGEGSWLHSAYAFLHCRSRRPAALTVGHDTGIYRGTFFELGDRAEVRIGNYCSIVGAIVVTDGDLEIGDYTFIAHDVVIADSFAAVPPGAALRSPSAERLATRIGSNVWVGARAILLGGTVLGDNCVVGAASVVEGEFPADCLVAGNPARVVRRIEARLSAGDAAVPPRGSRAPSTEGSSGSKR